MGFSGFWMGVGPNANHGASDGQWSDHKNLPWNRYFKITRYDFESLFQNRDGYESDIDDRYGTRDEYGGFYLVRGHSPNKIILFTAYSIFRIHNTVTL